MQLEDGNPTMQSDDITRLIIQIAFGLIGAYLVGFFLRPDIFLKPYILGLLGISVAGIVGGGLAGQLLRLTLARPSLDAGTMLAEMVGGAIGGGLLILIASFSSPDDSD